MADVPRKKPNRTKPANPTTVAERNARKGGKGGTPAFVPTDAHRAMVELYTAFGTPPSEIRLHIKKSNGAPISLQTLYNKFKVEMAAGLSKANAIVAGKLFEAAKNGNTTAQIFWLKARAKWREVERVELTGADGAPLEPTTFVIKRVSSAQAKGENGGS